MQAMSLPTVLHAGILCGVVAVAITVAAVNDAGQTAGLAAGELVRVFAPALGARGGGKADLAQGAGGEAGKLPDAFAAVRAAVASR